MTPRSFARLAATTVGATFVLVALGGFVRAMEAGLGCPDWPTCYGSPNPPSELAAGPLRLAWIEHSHRLWASVVMVLCVVQAWAARAHPDRAVRRSSLLLVPAVLSQALLGALVVWASLDAETVTLHLAGAMTVLGLGVHVLLRARAALEATPEPITPPLAPAQVLQSQRLAVLAAVTAGVTLLQLLVGSSVTGYDAGLAYTTFPSFQGEVLPQLSAHLAPWLHVSHRALAYTLLVLGVLLVRAARGRSGATPRLAHAYAGLLGVQVALGAANIWWRLSAWTVVPHLVVGAALWALALTVALQARWSLGAGPAAAPSSAALRDELVDA